MIDAHVHLWQLGRHDCRWPTPDLVPLYRDFMPADLWMAVGTSPVDQVLLVQSQESERDTRWLLSLALVDRRIAGVIGWTDLTATDAVARIDALAAAGPLVGIRPMVQDLAASWYDQPALDAGLAHLAHRGLVLEALVRPRHLPALARMAERHPTLSIVVDHGGKPPIGDEVSDWRRGMAALAQRPQVACKLSGLVTEIVDDRPATAVKPFMQEELSMFGPDRLIWGSDWPVVTLRAGYDAWLDLARAAIPADHRAATFGGNARRIYALPAAQGTA